MTLIPEVEAALLHAIDRHQATRGASRVPTSRGRGGTRAWLRQATLTSRKLVVIGVPVLVTLAVVAVVLSAGRASRPTAAANRPSGPITNGRQLATVPKGPTALVNSRRQLISALGVLRAPRTEAAAAFDQTGWPTPPKASGSKITPDRPLVRLATRTPWGANVFIVPLTAPRNPVLRKDLGETVAVWVQGIGWADYNVLTSLEVGGGWGPEQIATDRSGARVDRTFALVPDGVSKVAFYPQATLNQTSDRGPLVTATVHNNIAVFQTPAHRATHSVTTLLGYWYGPSGRIIKRFGFGRLRTSPLSRSQRARLRFP